MKVNLNKPSGASSPGAAAGKNEIIIIEAESIDVFPPSDPNGVVMLGNFVLKAGENMVTLYSTKSKTSASMETDGDEDSQSFKSKFDAQHPGNSREVKEFIQFWTGKNIIVLHKACGEDFYEVMGTPCAPLQLKSTKQDNNDGRHYMMSFEPFAKSGFVPKEYRGALVFAEPLQVVDVTNFAFDVNNPYNRLPVSNAGDSILFTGATNAVPNRDNGKIFTLIGSGGTDPAILSYGQMGAEINALKVLLKRSAEWIAIEGAVINLQLFYGQGETYFIEVSRG